MAIIGILPINSGIKPYLIKSSGSKFFNVSDSFFSSLLLTFAPKPIEVPFPRMPIISTLDDLDEKSLIKILKDPKNALTKQYKKLFEFENVELEFKDDALTEIAKKAINKKTGARGLRSILETILLKTMFELPELENVHKVTVDKSSVVGDTDPIVTYGKKQSTSAA